jgi:hypothetical protein
MIESPFRYEKDFTAKDYETVGKLSLRWSHIDHVLANCLKRFLRLNDNEAQAIVFQLTADHRFDRILELDKLKPLRKKKAVRALEELCLLMGGLRQVRNNVAHAVLMPGQADQIFESRKTRRGFSKTQILATEELTNYAAHAALVLRHELGDKDPTNAPGPLPPRPHIPPWFEQLQKYKRRIRAGGKTTQVNRKAKRQKART